MVFSQVRNDIQAVLERDPAARGTLEVVLCYPGLHALWGYRVAHWLWGRGWKLLARFLSNISRWFTLIEIHPGAVIGNGFFVDHGAGVVIGETCILGDNVTLYQGVTLGGTGKEKGKRHPTIGNNVVIGTGARVLGNIVVGDDCKIGAGAVVLRDVPANCTVVGNPGRIARRNGTKVELLDHVNLPDPVAATLDSFQREISELQQQIIGLSAEILRLQEAAGLNQNKEERPGVGSSLQ